MFIMINPFIPTDHFRSTQNNEWKSGLKLLSVERVKLNSFNNTSMYTDVAKLSTDLENQIIYIKF